MFSSVVVLSTPCHKYTDVSVDNPIRSPLGLGQGSTLEAERRQAMVEAMVQLRCRSAGDEWDEFRGFDKLWRHINARAA